MTLLITLFAAIISTFVWYKNAPEDLYRIRTLCFMFWGASLMWLIDAVFEYVEQGAAYFTPKPMDMLNDGFLGLSVIALAGVVWIIDLIVHDPKKVIKKAIQKTESTDTTNQTAQADSTGATV